MGTTIEILAGHALTGKTSRLIEAYRAELQREMGRKSLGRTLWLSPTQRACQQVRKALTAADLPVCFSPNILTFDGFAKRVLQFSGEVIQPLSPVMQRALLRRIIDAQAAQGELHHFGGIAHTSGFLDLVLGLISELKTEEKWPEEFEAACRARGMRAADRELAGIYRRYQERLLEQERFDHDGQAWLACEQLRAGKWGPFGSFTLVVIDGFTDFTPTEYRMLSLLTARSSRLLVSLPIEEPAQRPELFAKATAALDRLRALPGVRVEVRSPDPAAREVPAAADRLAFTQIARHLFGNPREVVPSPNAEGIEILAVTGQQGEVRALASRIKQLLLDGVSPEEIVVALRAPDDYADIVDEMFTAAGIPFSCDVAQPLTKWPPLKLLLGALQLEIEDWPFSRLMGLLDSNDFRPAWEEWANGQAVRDVADQLRHLGLDAGRDAILSHLARRAGGDAGETSAEGTRAAAALELRRSARSAVGLLERLSRTTAPLRRGADFKTWSEEILRLIGEFGLLPSADGTTGEPDSTAARELRIWEQFRETLMSVAFLAAGLEATPTKLEPREFLAELTDLLRTVTLPRDTQETGRVRILDSNHVRNLDVPYLFLAGLSESSFPTRSADDCIYGELDRRELNASGLTLGHRAGHLQGEMLLFYGVVTRARRQLVLSYPAVSGRGQPLSPSPYLTALRELFVPGALQVTRAERLDPVPELEGMLGLADLRIVATAEALERRPQLFAALAREPRGREAAQSILAAIDMGSARFQGRGFSPYEGVLQHPANLRELADRFSREYEFSATHLETYAQCPFRFWISRVLQVEPLEQPGVETDYRRRGIFLHQVLAQVHAELKSTLGTGSDSESLHADAALEIAACYQRLLKGILDRERPTSDLEEVLLGLEGRLLERWGTAYAAQWAKYQSELQTRLGMPLLPQKFEVPFGRPHPDAPPDDVVNACLVLGAGADETRVGGRIDRIDVAQVGDVTVFNIIDYKTGAKPRFVAGEVQFGRTLQLVLYALAVEKLGLIGPQAIPYQAGYWCIQESGFMAAAKAPDLAAGDLGPHPDWVNLTDALEEIVPRLAAGIRGGQFPVYNADDECTSQCAYKTVCRVNQIRPLEEKLDKSWQP